jgi:hypothetical protein
MYLLCAFMRKSFVKKIIIVVLIVLVLLMLGAWSPWNNWNLKWISLLGIDVSGKTSGLNVLSHSGNIDVYIDNIYKGTTIDNENFLEISPVDPGEHFIKLTKKTETGEYAEIIRKINFEPVVDVVVAYEIGPSERFSEGHILYTQKNYSKSDTTTLEIFSTPTKIKVSFDNKYIGDTPIKDIPIDLKSKHSLTFEREGYDSLSIEILPDSQEDRDKLKNLKLVLEVNLFARPLEIVSK